MTSYFTPIVIAGNGSGVDFYVQELPYKNSLRRAHENFGLIFKTYKEAYDKGLELISINDHRTNKKR